MVNVQLRRPGIFSYDIAKVVPVDVVAMVSPNEEDHEKSVEDRQKVNCCCCFGQGDMTLSACIAKGLYSDGDQVQLEYKVRLAVLYPTCAVVTLVV